MNLTTTASRNAQPLTLEAIQHYAPSALAVAPHESRSARYTYIPTREIITGMQREGFLPFSAKQSTTRLANKRDYTKHMIRFRHMNSANALVNVGDSIPEIVLVNSHDGSSAYKLFAGIFRLVCSNGMMVSDSEVESISVPHKGDIVGQVIEGSFKLAEHSGEVMQHIGEWSGLQLTSGEQTALAESARVLRFGDSDGNVDVPITAEMLLRPRRGSDSGADLWHTFNRVQENVIKGGLSARPRDEHGRMLRDSSGRVARRVTMREVKGIDQDVKLNRALWTLAEHMAKLKAA